MTRVLVLILLLAGLALPPVAAAQGAFGPLPPADSPPPVETPEPVEIDDGSLSTTTLWLIGGAVIVAFIGIGWYITRDARAHLTEDDRRAIESHSEDLSAQERQKRTEAQRKKARARAKAQRQARKKQRAR